MLILYAIHTDLLKAEDRAHGELKKVLNYTLIESTGLNRVNPRAYLNWVVEEIERSGGEIDYATLMPWYCPVGHLEG